MAILLLKKSYQHKDLKEIKFHDLWNSHGVFTTMRVIGKPARILFFKNHINNLFKSLKVYKINKKNIKKNILKLIKLNKFADADPNIPFVSILAVESAKIT